VLTGAVDDETFGAHDDKMVAARDTPERPPILRRWNETFARLLSTRTSRTSIGGHWDRGSAERRMSRIAPIPTEGASRSAAIEWERLDGHTLGRIGLAATDGSWVRQMPNGPHDDDRPRWSPDTAGR
jgi:hypothetical protein